MKSLAIVALAITVLPFAQASLINGGFENPVTNPGTFTNLGIPGWSSSGESGVWNIPSGGFFSAEAPEGTQIGYLNGASLSQISSTALVEGTNTLYFFGGRRSDGFAGSFRAELYAGGTATGGNIVGGSLLGSVNYIHTDFAPTTFTEMTIGYTAVSGDSLIGQSLGVKITRLSGQANFDGFRFEAVPEPATMLALIAGLAGLARRKKN